MSMIRPLLLSLAALLIVPATAHAEDDDVCVGWVHSFIDVEVDGKWVTWTSENTCLMRASSLQEIEPYGDGKPYRIGFPGYSRSPKMCEALGIDIDEMRRALEEANNGWDEVVAALDAVTKNSEERTAYDQAYAAWLAAQLVTNAAKDAYADVYVVEVETERDRNGLVVVVRQIGYRSDTELGRAVLEAIQREEAARRAMDEAYAKLDAATRVAQSRVDQYRSIRTLYPDAIKGALMEFTSFGCK